MRKLDVMFIIYAGILIFLIYLPIFHLVAFSFNDSMSTTYPWRKFTVDWWIGTAAGGTVGAVKGGFINDSMIMTTLRNSLIVGVLTTLVCLGIATPAALAIRRRFRGRDFVFYFLFIGMIYPAVAHGLGNLLVFNELLHISLSTWTIVFTLTIYVTPFALLILLLRFDPLLTRYEEAAATLGASGWKAFRTITLSNIRTEMIIAGLFAFTLAFGEVMRSFFVAPVVGSTLPPYLYAQFISQPPIPKYFALGAMITLVALVLVVLAAIMISRRGGLLRITAATERV